MSTEQKAGPVKDHAIVQAVNQLRDIAIEFGESAQLRDRIAAVVVPLLKAAPVDMILHCPNCGMQHVDEPDERTPGWTNPPHRSHLCHGCRHIWRPADVPTNGVRTIKTEGKNDSERPPQGDVDLDTLTRFEPRIVPSGYDYVTEMAACTEGQWVRFSELEELAASLRPDRTPSDLT